jgi:hypothetical protein
LKQSEQRKVENTSTYKPVHHDTLDTLICTWDVDPDFIGSYIDDYKHLQNASLDDKRTAWLTPYMATIYSPDPSAGTERYERQPVPDFIRWLETGEMHYLCSDQRILFPQGDYDDPALFQPSKILDSFVQIDDDPPEAVKGLLALLTWTPEEEVEREIIRYQSLKKSTMEKEKNREAWRKHEIFSHTVGELKEQGGAEGICFRPYTSKLEMVEKLAAKRSLQKPETDIYDGRTDKIPLTLNELIKCSVSFLRQVLDYHNCNPLGTKDEIVLKVFLLVHNRAYLTINDPLRKLRQTIQAAKEAIIQELLMSNEEFVHKKKRFSNMEAPSNPREKAAFNQLPTRNKVSIPEGTTRENLHEMFEPLLQFVEAVEQSKMNTEQMRHGDEDKTNLDNPFEQIKETGAKVSVKLDWHETGAAGGKPGWYQARVMDYDEDNDCLDVEYFREPNVTYGIDLIPSLSKGRIKLITAVFKTTSGSHDGNHHADGNSKTTSTGDETNLLHDISAGKYVTCVYEDKWWVGYILQTSDVQHDVQVKFMYPCGPSVSFKWPASDDICWVPMSKVICSIPAPSTTSGGRQYTLDKMTSTNIELAFKEFQENKNSF